MSYKQLLINARNFHCAWHTRRMRNMLARSLSRQRGWAGSMTGKHITAHSIYVCIYICIIYVYTAHTKPHYAYALHAKKLPPRPAPARKTSRKQGADADTINMHNL